MPFSNSRTIAAQGRLLSHAAANSSANGIPLTNRQMATTLSRCCGYGEGCLIASGALDKEAHRIVRYGVLCDWIDGWAGKTDPAQYADRQTGAASLCAR